MNIEECKTKGGKWENNNCVIKEETQSIPKGNAKEHKGWLSRGMIHGIIIIIIAGLLWVFRPAATCKWYNIFCWLLKFATNPIIMVICGILVLIGVYKIIKG